MSTVKVGFLGFGNVGSGTYRILKDKSQDIFHREKINIEVAKILVRDIYKKRNVPIEPHLLTDNIEDIIKDPDIFVVVECMGGVEPARQHILSALENKKTVVTANKELMARHWPELEKAAQKNGVGLYYEASVAGGIPIIKAVNESLQANDIYEIMGIINGTTNYILTKMAEEGRDYNQVLKEAQALGYAEPDPTADVEGMDAMYKLSILASIAFHAKVPIDVIYREGITSITAEDIEYGRELGYALKLLAIAKKEGDTIQARVHPTFIPLDHPLSSVRESYNAVFIKGDAVGNMMLYGRGAGDLPTGSAIVSDIISACQQKGCYRYTTFDNENHASEYISYLKNWTSEFFIRLTVRDKPGVLAKIASVFGKYGVSIASVIQKGYGGDTAPLIFVTHFAEEKAMNSAIQDIKKEQDVLRVENVIRVER